MRVSYADLLMYAGDAHAVRGRLESRDAEQQVAASNARSCPIVHCLTMRKQATSSSVMIAVWGPG